MAGVNMKKIISFTLLIAVLLSFSSCSKETRPDILMFSERLGAIDERYGFSYYDMFIYENEHHVYLNICKENDVMISFTTGNNANIENLTVTAFSDTTTTVEEKEELRKFYNAVIDSFAMLSDKEKEEKETCLSYNNTDMYFTDIYETYSSLRNNFIFSSNPTFMCLYCEYYEVMTNQNLSR